MNSNKTLKTKFTKILKIEIWAALSQISARSYKIKPENPLK